MKTEGSGGRGGYLERFDGGVLEGVLADGKRPEPLPLQKCANPKCGNQFRPRAEGDLYCKEACDLDANPRFRGRKHNIDEDAS